MFFRIQWRIYAFETSMRTNRWREFCYQEQIMPQLVLNPYMLKVILVTFVLKG